MKDELELLAMSLQFKFGFWIGMSSWQALLRLTLGWFSSVVERWLAGLIPEDREWLNGILNRRWYRVVRVLLNVLASVKLPGADAVKKAAVERRVKESETAFLKAQEAGAPDPRERPNWPKA